MSMMQGSSQEDRYAETLREMKQMLQERTSNTHFKSKEKKSSLPAIWKMGNQEINKL
jgi:hypothetical protein